MIPYILSFFFGNLTILTCRDLPSIIFALFITTIALIALLIKSKYTRYISCYLIGIAYIIIYSHWQNDWSIPSEFEGKPIIAQGTVIDIPQQTPYGNKFLFKLNQFNQVNCIATVKLLWDKNDKPIHPGDEWRFTIKIKKIHGSRNPGSYDYEAYAYQAGIRGSGTVVNKYSAQCVSSKWYHATVNRLREQLTNFLKPLLPDTESALWLMALITGERGGVKAKDWEVLRDTGTNHLMAIAGLHIGFMAALIYSLVNRLWRYSARLTLRMPAKLAGGVASLFMAGFYCALSGFSLPAQRALLMMSCYLFTVICRKQYILWQAWALALFSVLLLNPLILLTESFWLSFCAVALIIFGVGGRLAPSGLWWRIGRIQWVITLGLIPLSIALFHQYALQAFIANLIAIPLVAYLIVPGCFLGLFASAIAKPLAIWIFALTDKLMQLLWWLLYGLAKLPHVVWYSGTVTFWQLGLCLAGIIIVLLPKGAPGRYLGIILILPLVFNKPITPEFGTVRLTQLDVGQGLATVVQTQLHALVFDTGAHLSPSFDMGSSVVLPFLHSVGIKDLNLLVISHGDNDHIGGAESILNQYQVKTILTSVPNKLPHAQLCRPHDSWSWDGVQFEFLSPDSGMLALNNNSSCVLRIAVGTHQILLTGDIEKLAEKHLLITERANLPSDVVIAPHHGSRTSGVNDFLKATAPQYVIFSYGYRNRYHFPHPNIIKKYLALDAQLLNTVEAGAIQIDFNQQGVKSVTQYRPLTKRFWHTA